MHITLYPNGEIRARVPATERKKLRPIFSSSSKAESLNLSIVEKFSLESECRSEALADAPSLRVGFGGSPRPTPFSLYGRRKLVRCGALIGRDEARSRTLFLTGTLPGSTLEAFQALSDYSAWVVNELLTHIPRLAGKTQSDFRFIWVWEWQKRGALHWHCVIECPTEDATRRVKSGFRPLWIRIIKGVGKKAGVDMAERDVGGSWDGMEHLWRIEAEPARKNPSRYLAKYLSKPNGASGVGEGFPPSRWYGISRSLHALLAEETVFVVGPKSCDRAGRPVVTDVDLRFVEKMFGLSYGGAQFADKVRDGYTFVFYVEESVRESVVMAMNEYLDSSKSFCFSGDNRAVPLFPCLEKIAGYVGVLEMFLSDIGEYQRRFYDDFSQGLPVPNEELFFMERYAKVSLIRAGIVAQDIPPERSGAGLSGRNTAIMEVFEGVGPDFDQPSLFA